MPMQRCGESARQEWNAAYYLGLQEVVLRGFAGTFDAQVALGAGLLSAKGYVVGTLIGAAGVEPPLVTEHHRAARELHDGSFDAIGRAREAVRWLAQHVSGVDTSWLRDLVATYDALHGRGTTTFPATGRVSAGKSGPAALRSPEGLPRLGG
ncbi:MAG: hypothetical protein HZB55_24250 [Deltaproteobacteria bacterium]|nr:hypothetical protein [Deltaproteobacteria bacterium]